MWDHLFFEIETSIFLDHNTLNCKLSIAWMGLLCWRFGRIETKCLKIIYPKCLAWLNSSDCCFFLNYKQYWDSDCLSPYALKSVYNFQTFFRNSKPVSDVYLCWQLVSKGQLSSSKSGSIWQFSLSESWYEMWCQSRTSPEPCRSPCSIPWCWQGWLLLSSRP